eukprot:CAMPEP_0118725904 /NCGR_PEP_ID=MMETSP0800-20121206/33399_1 /TAXON_ID=210618 ORGANISM="Striatella unipunctata, Strain CCMP2910" /NCGR_SAMPLE_ID=MMETSP0800 /ASSEMBLY_ACC=CAM_ASM_000638 /LENGTH=281 /DNA_ID=CAMNT_0006634655 /DNA_START=606 /DNA_END=1448 /DNA_ORIENTATION=-
MGRGVVHAKEFHKTLQTLEGNTVELAMHIAENPFPIHFLPSYPQSLIELERLRLASIGPVTLNSDGQGSWWDGNSAMLKESVQRGGLRPQPLQPPPSLKIDISFRQTGSMMWTDCDYGASLSAVKLLHKVLLCIAVESNDGALRTIIDPIALAKGIFRCAEVARALKEQTKGEGIVTSHSQANTKQQTLTSLEQATHYKKEIGEHLKQCTELLLIVAHIQMDFLASVSSRQADATEKMFLLERALGPIIQATQLDKDLQGVDGNGEKVNLCKALATKILSK